MRRNLHRTLTAALMGAALVTLAVVALPATAGTPPARADAALTAATPTATTTPPAPSTTSTAPRPALGTPSSSSSSSTASPTAAVPAAVGAARSERSTTVRSRPPAGFVHSCGPALCIDGRRWSLHGASVLFAPGDPWPTMTLVPATGVNTIRIVDFVDWKSPDPARAAFDERRWQQVDRLLALARQMGLKAILDLSVFRALLRHNGINPYRFDWGMFVRFAAERVNTATGVTYRDDPTIALISVAGEVEDLNRPGRLIPTPSELVEFYRRTFAQLRAVAPHHLLSTGGLLHLDYDSGIPWREIFSLADCDVPALHVYSVTEEQVAIPAVAALAGALGKPWINEEFGFPQDRGDPARAEAMERVYAVTAAHGAAGVAIWNLGPEVRGVNGVGTTYDVNTSTPLALATVRRHAP